MMTTTDSQFQEGKILIIGDLIIDETWNVDARKLSPEGPIPVVLLTSNKPMRTAGGAGLAAAYAAKHKIPAHLLTACNRQNKLLLEDRGIRVTSIEPIVNVVKKRYIDINSGYHLIRVDNDEIVDPPNITSDTICPQITSLIQEENISMVAMLDYRKGMFFNKDVCQDIISLCKKNRVATYVDTRCSPAKFKGANYIKLNEIEYNTAQKELNVKSPFQMVRDLKINALVVTLGKEGAKIYSAIGNKHASFWPDRYKGTPDVTGCGDVFGVNFCYYSNKRVATLENAYESEILAVKIAVEKATDFAFQDVGKRL